jgi:hypothetical protein
VAAVFNDRGGFVGGDGQEAGDVEQVGAFGVGDLQVVPGYGGQVGEVGAV